MSTTTGGTIAVARETVQAIKPAVQQIAPMFFFAPGTSARGAELGYDGMEFYFAGRGGVLGDAGDEAVVAGFAYFTPDALLPHWHKTLGKGEPAAASQAFAEAAWEWARDKAAGFDGIERLAVLLAAVVEANDLGGATPLYSGWRAVPAPADAPAAAVQHLQALREHRGDVHMLALRAHRISVLDSMIGEQKNPGMMAFFGYTGPYPELDDVLRERRAAAEALTDELVAAAYTALDDDASRELAQLLPAFLAYLKA